MTNRRFYRLEQFIEHAHPGDIYQEETQDGFAILTYRAKTRRRAGDHLRAERIVTDLIAKGRVDYAYRTRLMAGTLFSTRDRHGDPAFLSPNGRGRVLALVEVPHAQHSQTGILIHHSRLTTAEFGPMVSVSEQVSA